MRFAYYCASVQVDYPQASRSGLSPTQTYKVGLANRSQNANQ